MKMEIKIFSNLAISLLATSIAGLGGLSLFTIYCQDFDITFVCIILLVLDIGFFIYLCANTAHFLIDEKGVHILRGKQEKNILPWYLVKTIGYQTANMRRYQTDFLYVSLTDRKQTKQLIETAKPYTHGLSEDSGLFLNKDVLRNSLDFTKTDKKLLILSEQTSRKEFDQLCRIQMAYAHQTGGEIAETYVNLEATEIDTGN